MAPRCSDEVALARAAYQQGDRTTDPSHSCYCCGRPAQRMRSLILTNKGWVCATDDFCRAGTSAARPQEGRTDAQS